MRLLLLLIGLAGCSNVCDQLCDAQADLLDRCLPEWGSDWQQEGWGDRTAFVERCTATWGDPVRDLPRDDDERQQREAECQRLLSTTLADLECVEPLPSGP